MSNPLISVPWDDCLLEPRRDPQLERFARRRMGVVPPAIAYLASRPWVARALVAWNVENGVLEHLDLGLSGLISMTVSQESACRYCYATVRMLLRIRGLSERRVAALERRLSADELDPRTLAAVRYARALSRAAPLPDGEERERLLAAGFTREEHRELAFVVAYTVLANRLHTLPALPVRATERDASGWRPALLRPVMLPMVWLNRRSDPPHEAAAPQEGAYAPLMHCFAGSPIAALIAAVVSDMSASTVLPPRVKALIFAVVAHALDCEISAVEARAMLPPGSSPDELDQALAHLGGPGVNPLEGDVARFARETIRYTPLDVQRRARELQATLSAEQFVEVVGLASMANALCRLAAAVLAP